MNFLIIPSVAIAAVVAAVLLAYGPAETAGPDATPEPYIGPPANYSLSQHDKEKTIKYMDGFCSLEQTEFYFLNHTISNGELKRMCGPIGSSSLLLLEMDVAYDGVLVFDVPFSVFNPFSKCSEKNFAVTVNHGADYHPSGIHYRYYIASYPSDLINAHHGGSVDDYLYDHFLVIDERQLIGIERFEEFSRITFPFFKDDVVARFDRPHCP